MHKKEESVPENVPLIPVILLKDTQVWAKLSEKMTESCMLLSGIASSSVAQFSEKRSKCIALCFSDKKEVNYMTSKLKACIRLLYKKVTKKKEEENENLSNANLWAETQELKDNIKLDTNVNK